MVFNVRNSSSHQHSIGKKSLVVLVDNALKLNIGKESISGPTCSYESPMFFTSATCATMMINQETKLKIGIRHPYPRKD
jgi:hypothetical protein